MTTSARDGKAATKPRYFATADDFRRWLEEHHRSTAELLVGFWKRDSGKASMTWPESVDEALSFGWIDGVRKSLGADAYTIRFTPRKRGSIWSAVNVAKVAALETAGKMRPAGREAFAARRDDRTAVYSFERKEPAVLAPAEELALRSASAAHTFFEAQPAWYKRTAIHWVVSAKRDATRAARLAALIRDSSEERWIGPTKSAKRPKATPAPAPEGSRKTSSPRPKRTPPEEPHHPLERTPPEESHQAPERTPPNESRRPPKRTPPKESRRPPERTPPEEAPLVGTRKKTALRPRKG